MADNLSCIGFSFADAEAFQAKMIELARDAVERLGCEAGDYTIWRSRTGAEIWFHLMLLGTEDNAADIAGLTPFFEGGSEIALNIVDRVSRPGDNAFEGAFTATICEAGDEADGQPLTFDAVDFAAHSQLSLPFRCRARLTGFAQRVRAFPDEAAFSSAAAGPLGSIGLAAKSFIPVGQFAEVVAEGDQAPSASTALLTGRVADHRWLSNEISGRDFVWLLVESHAATFDIVADPQAIEGEIVAGGTVEVGCVLFGRLLGE